jgi:hypothetical protein
VENRAGIARGFRRGLILTALFVSVAFGVAGSSSASHGGPHLSITGASATEGGTVTFTVTLSDRDTLDVTEYTVDYATVDGTAKSTAPGADYATSSGTLTFTAADSTETIEVETLQDTLDEAAETFTVTLSNASSGAAMTTASATGTINDDADSPPTVSIGNASAVTEGGTSSFPVTLSAPSGQTVNVSYSTANGSAVAPSDYDAVTNGSVTFTAGETTKSVAIATNDDSVNEATETFAVTLSSPSNATIASGQGSGTGTINDNDAAPTISIDDDTVVEGNSGVVFAVFTVSLSAPSGQQVTVNYATANGSAIAPSDYTAIGSTPLTFNAGETSKTVTVLVNGDGTDEANETFQVNLSGATNAPISDPQGIGTITDDDGPSITINDLFVNEGAGNAVFTVSLASASSQQVTVNYATANGTATAPGDYTAITSTTLTFAPGDTAKTDSERLGRRVE